MQFNKDSRCGGPFDPARGEGSTATSSSQGASEKNASYHESVSLTALERNGSKLQRHKPGRNAKNSEREQGGFYWRNRELSKNRPNSQKHEARNDPNNNNQPKPWKVKTSGPRGERSNQLVASSIRDALDQDKGQIDALREKIDEIKENSPQAVVVTIKPPEDPQDKVLRLRKLMGGFKYHWSENINTLWAWIFAFIYVVFWMNKFLWLTAPQFIATGQGTGRPDLPDGGYRLVYSLEDQLAYFIKYMCVALTPIVLYYFIKHNLAFEWMLYCKHYEYTFLQYVNSYETTDYRADSYASSDIKHIDPMIAIVRYRGWRPFLFFPFSLPQESLLRISVELLTHLIFCANTFIDADEKDVWLRLKNTASRLHTVNYNRFDEASGESVFNDTVLVAFGYWKHIRRIRQDLPFPR